MVTVHVSGHCRNIQSLLLCFFTTVTNWDFSYKPILMFTIEKIIKDNITWFKIQHICFIFNAIHLDT